MFVCLFFQSLSRTLVLDTDKFKYTNMIAYFNCGILFWKTRFSYIQNASTLNRPDTESIAAACEPATEVHPALSLAWTRPSVNKVADRKLIRFSLSLLPSGVLTVPSPLEAAPAVHGAPPGGELPGHLLGAATLLLRAAVHLCHQRPGAGQAAGVQLGWRPGRAARLLPAAETHRAGGNRSQGTRRLEVGGYTCNVFKDSASAVSLKLLSWWRRSWLTSLTPQPSSRRTTCWTCSPRSSRDPSPSPPPCR